MENINDIKLKKRLTFDQYGRYAVTIDIINANIEEDKKFKILGIWWLILNFIYKIYKNTFKKVLPCSFSLHCPAYLNKLRNSYALDQNKK